MHPCNEKCECGIFSLDNITPRNVQLSGYYKRSHAYYSLKVRVPEMIGNAIDYMIKDQKKIIEMYGEEAIPELKVVIDNIYDLLINVNMNKPIPLLRSKAPDAKVYNQFLKNEALLSGNYRFFTVSWLHAECFVYRQIKLFFENTKKLKKYDYFQTQKQNSFLQNINTAATMAGFFLPTLMKLTDRLDLRTEFDILLKVNLWSNRCDLILKDITDCQPSDPILFIEEYAHKVLANDSDQIWAAILRTRDVNVRIIDFICDNAGYELFNDFCLADFFTTYGVSHHVCFNIKSIPWFISDTISEDIRWLLRTLVNHKNRNLKQLGIRWNKYFRERKWVFKKDTFWTLPFEFSVMSKLRPDLYNRLAESVLIVIKGDLNYRKLFGEVNWDPTTPVKVASKGFSPTSFCIIRTIKCEVVCGLGKGIAEKLDATDPRWKYKGDYGVIQFSENKVQFAKKVQFIN